jgi:hypothetical protein
MRRTLKTLGYCFATPTAALVLWAAWNLRHSHLSILLIALALAAAIKAGAWSLRARKTQAICVSSLVLLTTGIVLSFVTSEFGALTEALVFFLSSVALISGLTLIFGIVRALSATSTVMSHAMTTIVAFVAAYVVLGTPASIYSTAHGYTAWYYMLPTARLIVDGNDNSGYVHLADAGASGRDVVVTVRQRWKGETFWIVLPTNHKATVSAGRTAPRFPLFSMSCLLPSIHLGDEPSAKPPERDVTAGSNFVEFRAGDGKRVRAEW